MATTRPQKIPLATLQETAWLATRTALEPFGRFPDDVSFTLGMQWVEDDVVFELYIVKDRPTDAVVLTETRVNQYDGQVQSVRIFEEAIAGVMATARP